MHRNIELRMLAEIKMLTYDNLCVAENGVVRMCCLNAKHINFIYNYSDVNVRIYLYASVCAMLFGILCVYIIFRDKYVLEVL